MTSQMACRPEWEIDKRLKLLIGENIRVRVFAFCPPNWNDEPAKVIHAANLVLPDNSTVHRDELYFEGKLLEYRRSLAVVFTAMTLWDTMRTGSDYWRPGKFLSDVAGQMGSLRPPITVTFLKQDEICPPADLLEEFRSNEQMSFAEYAHRYADYLRGMPGLLEKSAARVVLELAVGSLPAFFCTDPYIPDYVPPDQMLRVPYRERSWLKELRSTGCHRVVLAEEIVRVFLERGVAVKVFEIDPTRSRVFCREFKG